MEDITNSCLICGTSKDYDGFESLYENETETLSNCGNMYEELLGLKIDVERMDFYPKYLCPGCDLQLKIFYDLRKIAYSTLEKVKEILETQADEEELQGNKENYLEEYIEDEIFEENPEPEEVIMNELADESSETAIDEKNLSSKEEANGINENVNEDECPEKKNFNEMNENIGEIGQEIQNAEKILRSNHTIRQYVCSKCGKKLKNLDCLKAHMNSVHLGLAPYQCEICTTTFRQKAHLTYHLAKHNNKRDFKCKICDKGFLARGDLKIHMRFHNGERPYQCNTCGKTYTLTQHLKMHEFTHQKDSKSVVCRICQQSFSTPATLHTHKQTIHSEPQFHCGLCNKSFRRKHHLLVHQKTHPDINSTIAEEIVVEEISNESFSSNGFNVLSDTQNCYSTSDNEHVIVQETEQDKSLDDGEYMEQTSSAQLIYEDQLYIQNESNGFILMTQ